MNGDSVSRRSFLQHVKGATKKARCRRVATKTVAWSLMEGFTHKTAQDEHTQNSNAALDKWLVWQLLAHVTNKKQKGRYFTLCTAPVSREQFKTCTVLTFGPQLPVIMQGVKMLPGALDLLPVEKLRLGSKWNTVRTFHHFLTILHTCYLRVFMYSIITTRFLYFIGAYYVIIHIIYILYVQHNKWCMYVCMYVDVSLTVNSNIQESYQISDSDWLSSVTG